MVSSAYSYHPHSLSRDDISDGPDTDILFHRICHTGQKNTVYYSLRSTQGHTLQIVRIRSNNHNEASWSTYYSMKSELPYIFKDEFYSYNLLFSKRKNQGIFI